MQTPHGRRARVAILGYGHLGAALAVRLAAGRVPPLQLTHVLDRRATLKRTPAVGEAVVWTTRIDDVLASDADIIVELVGGVEPAREWMHAALARGKAVVTANKQVVARHGRDLLAFASRQGRQLRFEAAVGGAMPVVGAIRETLAGDRIVAIDAVLNGTSTFVLSEMERSGCPLADAVEEARSRGLAEADPASDLDGDDAAAKLAILCALAFGVDVDPDRIAKRTIRTIRPADFVSARRRERTIRQVASAAWDPDAGALAAGVGPRELPRHSFLGRTAGADNAALVACERAGDVGLYGRGAGGDATAVALVSDLLAIARDPAAVVPPPRWSPPLTITSCRTPAFVEAR